MSEWQERGSMDSIHQTKLKSGHLPHKMALVQSQRNTTVQPQQQVVFLLNSLSMESMFRNQVKLHQDEEIGWNNEPN